MQNILKLTIGMMLLGLVAAPHNALATATAAGIAEGPSQTTVTPAPHTQYFYLMRHAEKVADQGKDPLLSACGQAQAQAFAAMLARTNVVQVFHSGYQRTQQTASAMLTAKRQLLAYNAADLTGLTRQLLQSKQDVVVVGHSNTTPELATSLSGLTVPPLTEQDYGLLYQLSRTGQHWSLQLLQIPAPALCQN